MTNKMLFCTPVSLPSNLLIPAAAQAVAISPYNAPAQRASAIMEPEHIALVTTKYWGPTKRTLSVSFMDKPTTSLKTKILSHMNAWGASCGITFAATTGVGQVRIARQASGYWSYLGTDIIQIPKNQQTMNLQGFTDRTADSEFFRVVRHETGHTLGFPHEHMRKEIVANISPQKAYAYFKRFDGWSKTTVDQQVLTPLSEVTLMETPVDQTSIMCYQLPGSIMKDGKDVPGGLDIDASDYAFAAKVYPKN